MLRTHIPYILYPQIKTPFPQGFTNWFSLWLTFDLYKLTTTHSYESHYFFFAIHYDCADQKLGAGLFGRDV